MILSEQSALLFLIILIQIGVDGSVLFKRHNAGVNNTGGLGYEKSLFGGPEERSLEQEIMQEINRLSARKQREIFDDLEKQHEKFNATKSLVLYEPKNLSPLNVEDLKNIRKNIKTSNSSLPTIRNKRTLNFLLFAVARAMGYTLTPTNPDAEWIPRQQPSAQPCSSPPLPCMPSPPPSTPSPCAMPPTPPPCGSALSQLVTIPPNLVDANTISYPYRPARTIPLFNFAPLPAGIRVPYPPLLRPLAQHRSPCGSHPSPPPCGAAPAPSPPPCTTPAPSPPPCTTPPSSPPPCTTPAHSPPPCTTPPPSPPPCTTPAHPPPPCTTPAPSPPPCTTPAPSPPPCTTPPPSPPPCTTPAHSPPPCTTPPPSPPPCTTPAPSPPPCTTPAPHCTPVQSHPPCTSPAPSPTPCPPPASKPPCPPPRTTTPAPPPPCSTPAPPPPPCPPPTSKPAPPCGNEHSPQSPHPPHPPHPPQQSIGPKKSSIVLEYDDPVRIKIFSNDKKYLPVSGSIYNGNDGDNKNWHSHFYPDKEQSKKMDEDFEEMEEEHVEEQEEEEPGQLKHYEEEDERLLANEEEEENESETSLSIVKKPADQDIQRTHTRRLITSKSKTSLITDKDKNNLKEDKNSEKSQKLKKPKRKKWIRIIKKQRRKTKTDSNPNENYQIDSLSEASEIAPKYYGERASKYAFYNKDVSDFDDSASLSTEDVEQIDLKKVIFNKHSPELSREARQYEFNFNPFALEPEDQRRKKLEKAVERYVEDYVEKQLGDELIKNTGVPKTTVFEFAPKNGPKIQTITTTVAKHTGNPTNFKPQIRPEPRSHYKTPGGSTRISKKNGYEENINRRGDYSYEAYHTKK